MKPTLIAIVLGSLLTACGSSGNRPPAVAHGGQSDGTQAADATKNKKPDDGQGSLYISEDIRKACGLSSTTPYFSYNSASLQGKYHPVLDKLADCFSRGALKNRSLTLVGHCDPRGDSEYNMVLGDHRASQVARFLQRKGLPSGRVSTTSRGLMDASGHDERTWAMDRRVDVNLAE